METPELHTVHPGKGNCLVNRILQVPGHPGLDTMATMRCFA